MAQCEKEIPICPVLLDWGSYLRLERIQQWQCPCLMACSLALCGAADDAWSPRLPWTAGRTEGKESAHGPETNQWWCSQQQQIRVVIHDLPTPLALFFSSKLRHDKVKTEGPGNKICSPWKSDCWSVVWFHTTHTTSCLASVFCGNCFRKKLCKWAFREVDIDTLFCHPDSLSALDTQAHLHNSLGNGVLRSLLYRERHPVRHGDHECVIHKVFQWISTDFFVCTAVCQENTARTPCMHLSVITAHKSVSAVPNHWSVSLCTEQQFFSSCFFFFLSLRPRYQKIERPSLFLFADLLLSLRFFAVSVQKVRKKTINEFSFPESRVWLFSAIFFTKIAHRTTASAKKSLLLPYTGRTPNFHTVEEKSATYFRKLMVVTKQRQRLRIPKRSVSVRCQRKQQGC